jgi:hypothetical protein
MILMNGLIEIKLGLIVNKIDSLPEGAISKYSHT